MYENDLEWIVLFWIKQVPYIFRTERATEPKWNKKYPGTWSVSSYTKHLQHYFLLRTNCWIWELSSAIVVFASNPLYQWFIWETLKWHASASLTFPLTDSIVWTFELGRIKWILWTHSFPIRYQSPLCIRFFFQTFHNTARSYSGKSVAVWACKFFTGYVL